VKVGDLVEFSSSFFGKDYKNKSPGLVLEVTVTMLELYKEVGGTRKAATVLWSDGTTTKEHATFLKKLV